MVCKKMRNLIRLRSLGKHFSQAEFDAKLKFNYTVKTVYSACLSACFPRQETAQQVWISGFSFLNPMSRKKSICTILNCPNYVKGQGLCNKHYFRNLRYGDVNFAQRKRGDGATPEERFWSRVDKTETCWLWQGSRIPQGYGQVKIGQKIWVAHRYSWFLTYGFESKLFLLHSCDNPQCVNPEHLREGTHQENMADLRKRGRSVFSRPKKKK